MRVIAQDTQGNYVEFEADAKLAQYDVGNFRIGGGGATAKAGTASSGAVTLNKTMGVVTSESLTTAAAAEYTLTITNNQVVAGDVAFASVSNGTNSAGAPDVRSVACSAGQIVIIVRNVHASAALNGTLKIGFFVVKA